MIRENLIGAIYDNEEEWSCAYTCPHTMEEENPKEVCWRCAEKLLSEYEQQIRAEVIEKYKNKIEFEEKWLLACKVFNPNVSIAFKTLKSYSEQLKEHNV